MIKTIRLRLEYGCYPVWLYDENDDIVDTLLPVELRSDLGLDSAFDNLQMRFENLFVNNSREFSYNGFASEEEKINFLNDWDQTVGKLTAKVGDRYQIIDEIDKVL